MLALARALMAGSALVAALGAGSAASAPPERPPAPSHETGQTAPPDQDLAALVEPFLGSWFCVEEIQPGAAIPNYSLERHLLLRWQNDRLRVKTFDYLPDRRARARESDWNGTVREGHTITKQSFTPMPDGTISVGLGGTHGAMGQGNWWAAGTLEVEEQADGPVLRLRTTQGYVPSSKGNLWQPIDRTYRLVSREIDPEFLGGRR